MVLPILIIILIMFSALFSSCETAFASVNKIRLKNYASQGNKTAEKALKIAQNFDKALTAVLIGNNIVNIASASVSTVFFVELFPESGVGISTAVMTVTVLIFGEILPKSYANSHAEKLALFFATPLTGLIFILTPFIWFFSLIKRVMDKLSKDGDKHPSVTEDELKYIIEEIEEQGVLEEQESDLVKSALDFDEIVVDKILVPRVNVIGVEKNSDIDIIKDIFINEMYSRLPVYDKSLDNIIGIITQKEFFNFYINGGRDISAIIQDVTHISDLKPISETLKEMQRTKTHLCVVMDQHGGTKGIVTMEDVIEELVGEIYDEDDEVIPEIVKLSDDLYEVSGEMSVSDLFEELEIPDDIVDVSANSVGGWVMELLGDIPQKNQTFTEGIFSITVLEVHDQKIQTIKLKISLE